MKMLIGGKKVDASDGQTINVINPATGKLVDTIPLATKQDIALAVENPKIGQKEWAAIPILQRANIGFGGYKFSRGSSRAHHIRNRRRGRQAGAALRCPWLYRAANQR